MNKNQFLYKHQILSKFTIVKRASRLSVVVSDELGKEQLVHLTNTGRLRDLIFPGNKAICIPKKGRKTSFRLIGIPIGDSEAVLIDPSEQSKAFEKAVQLGLLPWLRDWKIKKPEVIVDDSRIDYQIESKGGEIGFIELKSAALLLENRIGSFPDCPTERGQKHLILLRNLSSKKIRTIILFIVTHPLAESFSPNAEGDSKFVDLLKKAVKDGLEVKAVKICLKTTGNVVLVDSDLPCFVQ